MKKYSGIVVVGSVGFDVIMGLPGRFADWIMPEKIGELNVSFTVESLRREYGGTGGNCAYTLGLLGVKPRLVSVLGKDGLGYRKHLARVGVDVSELGMDKSSFSAVGHVMTDKDNNQIWSYYPGPLVKMEDYRLQMLVKPGDLVVLLPSYPKAFGKHLREVVKMGNDFLFDPAFFIPNLSVADLGLGLREAAIVIGNEYEITLMEKRTGIKVREGNKIVIMTMGERGSVIYQGAKRWQIPAVKVKRIVDPTGAGDAYRAGFLVGYIAGNYPEECGRMGALTGAWCVEHQGTQNHQFTHKEFRERLYGNKDKS